MAVEILEIHHTGVRVDDDADLLKATQDFYADVLGLQCDSGRPTIPGIPGAWVNVGEVGQIHLIGGKQPSPVAKGPGQDPTRPHVAYAVKSVVETRAELDRLGPGLPEVELFDLRNEPVRRDPWERKGPEEMFPASRWTGTSASARCSTPSRTSIPTSSTTSTWNSTTPSSAP